MIYKIQEYCKLRKQRTGYKGTKALYGMEKKNLTFVRFRNLSSFL